jgi:XTP/dITP diphosphohydrolase
VTPEITFVTSNKHKFAEAEGILRGIGITVKHLLYEYPELQLMDPKEIAENSARFCFNKFRKPLFVEDSGISVPSLGGFPGPFTSYVLKTIGTEGLLKLAKGMSAEAHSIVTYIDSKTLKSFVGKVTGKLVSHRGNAGFGFDPIFLPDGYKKTFGEDATLKSEISHRRRAVEMFGKWCKENGKNSRQEKRKVKV